VGLFGDVADRVLRKVEKYKAGESTDFTAGDIRTIMRMTPFTGLPIIGGALNKMVENAR
jgi:hypothetical protein